MKRFHAYEITSPDSYDLGVERDAATLTRRLADDLKRLADDAMPVLRLRIGMVAAATVEAALAEIRSGHWLDARIREAELLRQGWGSAASLPGGKTA